jgi:antitoxin ParD1/3/4
VNVSLNQELEKLVGDQLASGRYASASEVIREALRLLCERDQVNELRREVRRGIDQLDGGHGRPFDQTALERIRTKGRKRLAAGKTRSR